MPCPHCATTVTIEQRRRTALGYRTFRCRTCCRTCNERTGTSFNHRHYPTALVVLVVLWRLRDKLVGCEKPVRRRFTRLQSHAQSAKLRS